VGHGDAPDYSEFTAAIIREIINLTEVQDDADIQAPLLTRDEILTGEGPVYLTNSPEIQLGLPGSRRQAIPGAPVLPWHLIMNRIPVSGYDIFYGREL
jgi:hypothetical protein